MPRHVSGDTAPSARPRSHLEQSARGVDRREHSLVDTEAIRAIFACLR